jgi:hypothetical protein
MNMQHRNLLATFCFIVLITACSNEPSIISATPDRVVVTGPPEKFVAAYDKAKKECEKNTKNAIYIADTEADLKEVAFDCIGEEAEVVAETTTEEEPTEAEDEIDAGIPVEIEAAEEVENITEEIPVQE